MFGILLVLQSSVPARAGGGPAGFIVVYNPNDPRSVTIANYYQRVRNIPERNMVPYAMPGYGAGFVFTRTTAWDFVYSLRQTLAARGLNPQLQGITLAGVLPLSAAQVTPDPYYGGSIYSIQSFLYLSPNYSQASFPATLQEYNPAYAPPENFNGPAPTGTIALAASTVFSNQLMFASGTATVWPVGCIGIPGTMGNSVKEILSYIDRAKSHDGVKPAGGKIYWPLNGDIRSSVRQFEINDVAPVWNARGIPFIVTGTANSSYNYAWVSNRVDIQGGVPGTMSWTDEGNTYLPGAWVDHMTSYGGYLDSYSFMSAQFTGAHWLRMGVDGTAGNVAEPYANSDKCPHANIHTHLRAGASQVEAFWQSLAFPAEMFFLGDPLLQVFASFPVVTVSAPTNGASVSGTLAIAAAAAPTGGKTLETNLDLFIDGRRIAIGSTNEAVGASRTTGGFSLDTTTIADGWHEIRVVAYNADAVRTQNEKELAVTVNNQGQSITLAGTNSVNPNGTAGFTLTPSGLSDLTSLVLQANGRVLASLPLTGGTTNLSGTNAPLAGNWTLFAIGTRANGQQVWSAPFTTAASWPAMAATNNPPLGNAMADVRVFNSTTNSGFNWDTTPPDVVTKFYGTTNAIGLNLTTGNFSPFLAFTNVTSTWPGLEIKFWFYAPTDDWYEFGKSGDFTSYLLQLTVDGQTNNMLSQQVWGINHLAPGWHLVRLRTYGSAGGTQIIVYVRGGASQDFVYGSPATMRSTDTNSNPSADAPTISFVAPSASPVTGTNVTFTVNATIGGGSSNELAGLKYIWTVLSAPSNTIYSTLYNGSPTNKVTFSTNGY